MRVAVLSDIHANWQALEAVLDDMPTVDDVICLGDVVGYGGDPVRCVDEVASRRWQTLVGNHDQACIEPSLLPWFNDDAAKSITWTTEQLGTERLDWLKQLAQDGTRDQARFVHASPRDPTYEYILDFGSAYENLQLVEDVVCFHGHTHLPGIFRIEGDELVHEYERTKIPIAAQQLVNPGSVGQPRDGEPDASYGIWDMDSSTFEFRRVPYDREEAKRAIREAGLPKRFGERLDLGR